jgi:hypothetical protein
MSRHPFKPVFQSQTLSLQQLVDWTWPLDADATQPPATERLSAIRPAMVELGCLRLVDPAYPGPAVLEAVARRLLRK